MRQEEQEKRQTAMNRDWTWRLMNKFILCNMENKVFVLMTLKITCMKAVGMRSRRLDMPSLIVASGFVLIERERERWFSLSSVAVFNLRCKN
jgi:hypothetical protein